MILFKTNWRLGTVSDNVISYCKQYHIDFRYNYFQLELFIDNKWVLIDYKYNKSIDELIIFVKES